jgi:transcription elongation factor GreB
MSRGFVKEDDQEDIPMVPPRAYLPEGVTNFVTPEGMDLLLKEREILIREKEIPGTLNENERRISLNFINAKLLLLNNRIAGAKIVNISDQPNDEIRFGAIVTLRNKETGKAQTIHIVGVDEAAVSKGKISFISPMARLLINKKRGDVVTLMRDKENLIFEVTGIAYQ